ncbi:MAG: efflux RND transporter periplasmic adaptor subunit [Bacteroidia bacterium]|nr:efflux RND transporter periplasmic adaptor subunit [Bacteroidia bacterium]
MFKSVFYLIIGLSLFLSACSSNKKGKSENAKSSGPIDVDVSIAKVVDYANIIEANGNILAQDFVELKSEISGRIVFLNIKEGAWVSEGTLLVKLNDEDLQAQLRKYKSQLELAVINEKRLNSLYLAKGINAADYDQAVNQVNNIEADIAYTDALLRKTEIRAPFSGVIGLRNVSKGAIINSQDVLATLQAKEGLKVDFVLPESYVSAIKNGSEVDVISSFGSTFKARIIGVEPQINTATRNIKIRALLLGDIAGLSPGAFVKVKFNEGAERKRMLVTSNCIIPETRFKKMAVIKNGKIVMTVVETGIRNGAFVEITNGLNIGDTFAINGLLYLKPDAEVKVRSVK